MALPVLSTGADLQPPTLEDEIVVTVTQADTSILDLIGNTARLDEERIRLTNPQHIYDLGVATAGTWFSEGSGQENLTAIRSPVLTGPGACGAFRTLENSVPTRPTGFCNVNQLFEIPSELARGFEVVRGPTKAHYGSNGLHGTVNVLLPEPGEAPHAYVSGTAGADDFYRGKFGWSGDAGANALNAGLLLDTYGGFREYTGYDQQKGYARLRRPLANSTLGINFSAQNLDQDTGGFILGEDAYKDSVIRTTNPNPEAFRKANSQRFSVDWTPDQTGFDLTGYLRHSDMEFLQHFIPGQPLEENGQVSGGLLTRWQLEGNRASWSTGLDVEFMDAFISQYQAEALNGSSDFLNEVLPQGQHYDFDVTSALVAPFAQLDLTFATDWRFSAGLRLEYMRYDYDNKMLDGNTRDDGTSCDFGGCRYTRPADRTDDFFNAAPNIGLWYRINPSTTAFVSVSRGFRAPQITELYRLQNGQNTADLDTVTLDNLELGLHWQTRRYRVEATTFAMVKRNEIFQDSDRNNISDGKTDHIGVELQAAVQAESGLYAGVAGTWARHTYAFSTTTPGDDIFDGNDVDTAPRTLASARLGFDRRPGLVELEGIHQGSYYLNPSNTAKYDGHNLLNLRGVWRINDRWSTTLRINNLTDQLYATRADFAFGDYRYFPGRLREFLLEIAYRAP